MDDGQDTAEAVAAAHDETLDANNPEGHDPETVDDPNAVKLEDVPPNPLTNVLVGEHISLLARTGNGLSHAYTRLEIHGKAITDCDVLENYVHLRYIDLSDNAIMDISALQSLEYLLSIDFHSNRISNIPASLDKRKYLQQANFAKNSISAIHINSWPLLAWLNLNENKLGEVKLNEFGELIHLEARQNKITHTKGINAKKLERLYLAGNKLTEIELEDKPRLQTLHLRDNKIENLDGLNESLKSLAYINLRNNRVSSISEVAKLAKLPALKVLILTENPVTELPGYRIEVLSKLPQLEKLDKDPVSEEERFEATQKKD